MNRYLVIALLFSSFCSIAYAQTIEETKTSAYFETIKNQPSKLTTFLHEMPKGADLHVHQSGATFAENLLRDAQNDQLCINKTTYVVFIDPQCPSENLLMSAIKNSSFYDQLIDAWSMRHFQSTTESGHDHFFATFGKFDAITKNHHGEVLGEITERAARENELYIEVMSTLDGKEASSLGKSLGWDPDFSQMREKLLAANFDKIINDISANIDKDEAKRRTYLHCETSDAKEGCNIKLRFLYQVLREQAPEMVFAQMLAGFEAASKDPRVVGLNMVQPEDGKLSMQDYQLQMQMMGYLHELYPTVKVSLHAGELSSDFVSPEGLTFHINDAVRVAKANRIGHGVDIAQETNADLLLNDMATNHVMVEINLSSNAAILNVQGENHPLPLYMRYGVPVSLSTDDEGVARSNLTMEYKKAVDTYHFSYATMKLFSRNSLFYSFLPGKNLWQDFNYTKVSTECAHDRIGSEIVSSSCQAFLTANEKAATQWNLEKHFNQFERKFR